MISYVEIRAVFRGARSRKARPHHIFVDVSGA